MFFGLFNRRRPTAAAPPSQEQLEESINANKCPDCHSHGFHVIAEGGLSQNIRCDNPKCGSRFNVSPIFCERISEPSPLKAA